VLANDREAGAFIHKTARGIGLALALTATSALSRNRMTQPLQRH
jgi:hypothetical protein